MKSRSEHPFDATQIDQPLPEENASGKPRKRPAPSQAGRNRADTGRTAGTALEKNRSQEQHRHAGAARPGTPGSHEPHGDRHARSGSEHRPHKNNPNHKNGRNVRNKKKKRRSIRVYGVLIMLTLIFVISISLSIGIIEVGKDMLGIDGSQKLVIFNIREGATTTEIAENLKEDGIIRIPKAFVYFSRLSNADFSYVPGEHEISASMAYEALVDELQKNPEQEAQQTVDIMFPEGISLYDAALKLKENNVISDVSKFLYYFNSGKFGYEFENYLPETPSRLKFYAMEGYFFPDTYTFTEEMEPDIVCRKIYMNFNIKMTEEYYQRIEEMGTTLDEVITLASMVQAEAANEREMRDIASVFWNRLQHPENFGGGKLQSDPTSKYVTEIIRPNIELENQQIYDAYDTYVCVGLPAGAIGNPGIDAIEAVLYPSNTNYFYFYANIDTGITYFAETLEQHNANIEMVQQLQAEAAAAAEEASRAAAENAQDN